LLLGSLQAHCLTWLKGDSAIEALRVIIQVTNLLVYFIILWD